MKNIIEALRDAKIHIGDTYYGTGRESKLYAKDPPGYDVVFGESIFYNNLRTALVEELENAKKCNTTTWKNVYKRACEKEYDDEVVAEIASKLLGAAIVDATHVLGYAAAYFCPKGMKHYDYECKLEETLNYNKIASDVLGWYLDFEPLHNGDWIKL